MYRLGRSALARGGASRRRVVTKSWAENRSLAAPAALTLTQSPKRGRQGKLQAASVCCLHTFHTPDETMPAVNSLADGALPQPFFKLLAANRGEIATRINRAAAELGISTAGIYSHEGAYCPRMVGGDGRMNSLAFYCGVHARTLIALCCLLIFMSTTLCSDRFQQHRYKCDQAFGLDSSKSPVAQYLDIHKIVDICVKNKVEAVHPGYGFLSENEGFAKALEEKGIVFVGPTVKNLQTFGDKTTARNMAIANGVPVVAGSKEAFASSEDAGIWISDPVNQCEYPVIVKALMGGGGRGIRIVPTAESLVEMFQQASNEALNAFGDGRCFVEKYVDKPRHVEVQCLGDGTGNVVHLWDRDCSVQRRHQKVIELAPAEGLKPETRQAILDDAVRLLASANYRNAGTVEFLVDKQGKHYFMEVNPRVQVEHTVTEEITGIDIVQSQILIASGKTLRELNLTQDQIAEPMGCAMQVRTLYQQRSCINVT